jgi:hypothetical protein
MAGAGLFRGLVTSLYVADTQQHMELNPTRCTNTCVVLRRLTTPLDQDSICADPGEQRLNLRPVRQPRY